MEERHSAFADRDEENLKNISEVEDCSDETTKLLGGDTNPSTTKLSGHLLTQKPANDRIPLFAYVLLPISVSPNCRTSDVSFT
jgi:hypothetical protein